MKKYYVDFHLHSIVSRSIGDSIGWFGLNNTLAQIYQQQIKAFAFTDHDCFDYEQYLKVKEIIDDRQYGMICFPGVEITIKKSNGRKAHVLFIFNDDYEYDIQKLEYIIAENKSDYGTNLKKFINAINDYEYVMIPHVGKSADNVDVCDVYDVLDKISYVEVNPNHVDKYKRFCKKANREITFIYFSDTHCWGENGGYQNPGVYVETDSFDFKSIFKDLKYQYEI